VILLLSDVHAMFHVVNAQIDDAERRIQRSLAGVLALGDMGLFEPDLKRFFVDAGQRFKRPVHFLEGNHEDFGAFPRLVRRYAACFAHLPRASVHVIDGHHVLALGGAAYMDSATTPPGSAIAPADIESCLRHPPQAGRIILSHDCPAGIGVPSTPGFEHYDPTGFAGGDRLSAHFQPRLWFFGHHHKWFDRTLGRTRYIGLPQSWEGYALLSTRRTLRFVRNRVPIERRLAPRLLRLLWF